MRVKKTKMEWLKILSSWWICIFLGMPLVSLADIAVIVHPANHDASITRSDVQYIFLGLKAKLTNDVAVTPLDQSVDQPIRQKFYQLVAGKTPVQMQSYWSRLIFTGKGKPPTELSDDKSIRAYVASNKNAIGYVDAASVKGALDVSTIFVIPTQ